MEALPHGSLSGGMRMTEQGETIAQKYAHLGSAVYNSELLIASATAATARHRSTESRAHPALEALFDTLAATSRDAYRAFLHTPDFMKFYRQATPIDALENARIGSRPARRTGQATLDDLRAIPWVFSWSQARYYIPGWYGMGSALKSLTAAEMELLTKHRRAWPFWGYVLTNVESSLASADTELMDLYASLVEDETLRSRFQSQIRAEWDSTQLALEQLRGGSLKNSRPRMLKTLGLRSEALRVLHHQQVVLLREWRGRVHSVNVAGADALLPELLLSINAIASGLRTTG
jgi:phosphoenolpyruvate carboxylase